MFVMIWEYIEQHRDYVFCGRLVLTNASFKAGSADN